MLWFFYFIFLAFIFILLYFISIFTLSTLFVLCFIFSSHNSHLHISEVQNLVIMVMGVVIVVQHKG